MSQDQVTAPTKHRGLRAPWKKGESGNPGGRPALPKEIWQIAKAASPEAIRKAIEWMRDPDPKVSLKAIEIILDRGLGRPQQSIELNDVTKPPAVIVAEPLTVAEWAALFGPETPA